MMLRWSVDVKSCAACWILRPLVPPSIEVSALTPMLSRVLSLRHVLRHVCGCARENQCPQVCLRARQAGLMYENIGELCDST
eukprot:1902490-Pleurochrysis_carterae.AAC.1